MVTSPTASAVAVLAHQGGWDEILLVAGPIALLALVLVVADRRARRLRDGAGVERTDDPDGAGVATGDEATPGPTI